MNIVMNVVKGKYVPDVWWKFLIYLIFVVWCAVIGLAGTTTIAIMCIGRLTQRGYLSITAEKGALLAVVLGGVFGMVPLAMIGLDWISSKIPPQAKRTAA